MNGPRPSDARKNRPVTGLRYAHTIAAIAAGLALAASLFGYQRIAVALLALIVLILTASIEALRYLAAHPEKRP